MKHRFSVATSFYKNNGMLGICLNKIGQLRAGAENFERIPHAEVDSQTTFPNTSGTSISPETQQWIDDLLEDESIPEAGKKPWRRFREEPIFGDSEKLKRERLIACLKAKAQYPIYSKIKGKIPYAILAPFTWGELSRLAAYRVAGFISAPITMSAVIGFSLPCAVTFSMLEMYVPDKFKFPCKCAKWSGGIAFYGVCSAVDFVSAGFETKVFGEPLPIDAPQLMGTLPSTNDIEELGQTKKLLESLMKKSPTLGD